MKLHPLTAQFTGQSTVHIVVPFIMVSENPIAHTVQTCDELHKSQLDTLQAKQEPLLRDRLPMHWAQKLSAEQDMQLGSLQR